MLILDPNKDGETHINIYSRGVTGLGRRLSNFAHTPFTISDGTFASVEGYWYWLLTNHENRNILKGLYGYEAKKEGRKLVDKEFPIEEYDKNKFKHDIERALRAKLKNHSDLLESFIESTLPFSHYYVYNTRIVVPDSEINTWLVVTWEKLREEFKEKHEKDQKRQEYLGNK